MSLFAQQTRDVEPAFTVEQQRRHADLLDRRVLHRLDLIAGVGGDHSALGAVGGELDPLADGDQRQVGDVGLDPRTEPGDRQNAGDVVHGVSLAFFIGQSGRYKIHDDDGSHGNAPEHRIFAHLNPCAQHDAETTDRQADHLTPFGARVPAPIAVPPRRSARHPHLILALLWLAAFLSTGTAALLALQALSDWNHAQELAARI